MKPREELPEGVKAAAVRFAKACVRDGYAEYGMTTAKEGQPVTVHLRNGDEVRAWMWRDGRWHDFSEVGDDDD